MDNRATLRMVTKIIRNSKPASLKKRLFTSSTCIIIAACYQMRAIEVDFFLAVNVNYEDSKTNTNLVHVHTYRQIVTTWTAWSACPENRIRVRAPSPHQTI